MRKITLNVSLTNVKLSVIWRDKMAAEVLPVVHY